MEMTSVPMKMDFHQRLRKIVVEYSNKWLIPYLLEIIIYGARGPPNFVFVFGPKNDDFLFFGVLFFGRKSLMSFRCYFIFRPKKSPKNRRECHELELDE